ncbi:hypothetical protein [Tepidimonas sp.]|uniref:DUF7303 family protein n=1 Tax=Tepidimonas sp. TaxID=2002775 RepID=UPI00391A8B78
MAKPTTTASKSSTAPKIPAATPAASAPAAAPVASGFVLEDSVPLPAVVRTGGKASNYPLASMNVNQSFLVATSAPASISDPAERAKALGEENRRVSNRLSGVVRRFKKTDASKSFAIRTVDGGVRVWRTA